METLTEKVRDFLTVKTGSGYGYGYGDGSGDGSGYGYGSGDGSGDGYGSGSGSGYGYGYGDGSGSDISSFDGHPVHRIDDVPTIIRQVSHGFARGHILNDDLTLTKCVVAKSGNVFAHGATVKLAVAALQTKLFEDMPEEDRIAAFIKEHRAGEKYPARDLWIWHNRLTGSCEMGRNQFARDRGINIDKDSFTPEEFCSMCRNSYGRETIRRLEEAYAQN